MATQQQPPRGNKPGAMTMAMQAVQTVQGPKVLRIGMIQGGKILEERIIRARDTVSVGTTERNVFTVIGPNLPSSFELFQMVGGNYKLNFTDTMEGRVAMPQGLMSLKQLKESGQAVKSNVGWQVPLNEQCRGKVTLGDVQFLFQFVAPPPPQPKPQLPAAIRAGWVKNIDWTYNACLSFFLLFAFSGMAYVEYLYDPLIEDVFTLDARMVQLSTPPAIAEPEPEAAAPTPTDNTPAPTAAPQPSQQPSQQAAANPEQRAARAAAQADRASQAAERAAQAALNSLSNSAEFAALTGATDTGRGSAADRLASGGLMQGSVDSLANTGGISAASGNNGVRRGGLAASAGGPGGGGLGRGTAVAGGGENIGSGQTVVVERRVSGNASLGSGDAEGGEGTLDASRVAGILRSNIGGIRSCYERALRNNPTLSGRLEIRFTIGTSGRVTGTPSTSGLSAAPEVGSCIASRVRSLVFPAPNGGAVDFNFPFSFAPGG
ncbi:MAG: AgmX/PglI C-terminal domain-containing protein [Deltaproteobacteria bacterium]|nr:AgmX/PglI C-terminal domain-containing protein [Deltaproteobacteria bacterium]